MRLAPKLIVVCRLGGVTFADMKIFHQIVKAYRRKYYLRIYRDLFWTYTRQGMDAHKASWQACIAFEVLTGFEYKCILERYS